jgi:hypothetical protein
VHIRTGHNRVGTDIRDVIAELTPILRGWGHYFRTVIKSRWSRHATYRSIWMNSRAALLVTMSRRSSESRVREGAADDRTHGLKGGWGTGFAQQTPRPCLPMPPAETVAGPGHTAPGEKEELRYPCAWRHYGWNPTPAEREVGVSRGLNLLSRHCRGSVRSGCPPPTRSSLTRSIRMDSPKALSGSTRQPAGAFVTHENAIVNVDHALSDSVGKEVPPGMGFRPVAAVLSRFGSASRICGPLTTESSAVLTSTCVVPYIGLEPFDSRRVEDLEDS